MELYSGLALSSVLNTHTADGDWDSPFQWVEVSYWSGLVSMILLVALPTLLFIPFYCMKRD